MRKQIARAGELHQVGHGCTITASAAIVALCIFMAINTRCSSPTLAGVGSEVTNGTVMGSLCNPDGSPAAQTRVMLIPNRYDPVKDNPVPDSLIDTTDEGGTFSFHATSGVVFNIEAFQPGSGNRALITDVTVNKNDTLYVPTRSIQSPGAIRLTLSTLNDLDSGYVFIAGTTRFAEVQDGKAIIDSVPWGLVPSLVYVRSGDSEKDSIIATDLEITSGNTVVIENASVWNYSKRVSLNTSVSGAGVAGMVVDFPVLIRLNSSNFDFSKTRVDGGDLRFTKESGIQLPYEIERFDPAARQAEVWVKLDTVYGNDSTQSIIMCWGNTDAVSNSNSAAVFDTSNGFQGVWHLNENGKTIVNDATGNHFNGTSSDTAPGGLEGQVGLCRSFNGLSNYIRINGTANGKLNFQENSTYTISAWVYTDTLDNGSHLVVGKGNEQYYLKIKQTYPPTSMVWEFVEYHEKAGWVITNGIPTAKSWTYLVGVRKGTTQYLYINGLLVDSTSTISTPSSISRQTGDDVTIGQFLSLPSDSLEGRCPFLGNVDEVRISDVACGPDWIKLCFINQNEPNVFVKW